MHFKQDENFEKVAQFIKANPKYRIIDENLAGDLFEDLYGILITYPYEQCEGKTFAEICDASDEEIVETLGDLYWMESVPTDILEAFRALVVERGQCECGGELRFLEIPFGAGKGEYPYRHICCHCYKKIDCSQIYNE